MFRQLLYSDVENITTSIDLNYYHYYHQKNITSPDSSSSNSNNNISSNNSNPIIIGKKIRDKQSTSSSPSLTTSSSSLFSNICLFSPSTLYFCYDKRRMILSFLLLEFPFNIDTDSFVLKEYDRLKMLQEQKGPRHTEILLRKEDNVGGRKALKEKFVEIYEAFFNGEDPSVNQPSFWEQLFLIKVNTPFLERCIILTSEDHLLTLKQNINKIFTQSCHWLRNPNTTSIRIVHILETLGVLLKSIFRKKFNNFGFDILNILCGIDAADTIFKELIEDLQKLLKHNEVKIRILVINLLNIFVTATEYLNQNTLLQFFMNVDIFDTLIETVLDQELPKSARYGTLSFLIYLSNFQKYEITNIYSKHIGSMNDNEKIKGIVEIITNGFKDQNTFYFEQFKEPNQSMASRFSGYLSSWVYTPQIAQPCSPSETGSCLMMFYELVYQNETFIKLLSTGALSSTSTCPEILKEFFIYCSYLASDTRKESKPLFTKLCLNIILLMSENRELQSYFHDVRTSSYIFIYSKKTLYPDPKELDKHPISCFVIDVINQFIKCNIKGKIPCDIQSKAIQCIQRNLSYKKTTNSRLPIKWIETWTCLFGLIGAINSINDKAILSETIPIGIQAINIFNIFISSGDTFLPQPSDYDDLFYEIIRAGSTIHNFSSIIEMEDPTGSLMNPLVNIKSIISHFNAHIQHWTNEHPEETLTSDLVIKLIRENYDTLRLKLQNEDNNNPFVENNDAHFYRMTIKYLVQTTRTELNQIVKDK